MRSFCSRKSYFETSNPAARAMVTASSRLVALFRLCCRLSSSLSLAKRAVSDSFDIVRMRPRSFAPYHHTAFSGYRHPYARADRQSEASTTAAAGPWRRLWLTEGRQEASEGDSRGFNNNKIHSSGRGADVWPAQASCRGPVIADKRLALAT